MTDIDCTKCWADHNMGRMTTAAGGAHRRLASIRTKIEGVGNSLGMLLELVHGMAIAVAHNEL